MPLPRPLPPPLTAAFALSPPLIPQGTFTVVDAPCADSLPYGPEADAIKAHFPHTWGKPAVHLVRAPPALAAGGGLCDPCRTQLRVGIVLSGGQAPGGHNVIGGLLDSLMHRHPGSHLFGFLDGPRGIMERNYKEITVETMVRVVGEKRDERATGGRGEGGRGAERGGGGGGGGALSCSSSLFFSPPPARPPCRAQLAFRNQGGFHMICSGRDKIEKPADLARAAATAAELDLDGLVVCGGDDSNTNAAVLAEYFASQGLKTAVVGVPKTIDGDLKNERVATSFGFDTACKVYSEAIGNIMTDAASAKKYYHFIRLMGRAASHVTLECALQTHPQEAIICEEVDALGMTLADVTNRVADIVAARSAQGKDYGVVLLPEGLIEHVPQMRTLICELNDIMADGASEGVDEATIAAKLGPESGAVFAMLPPSIRSELLLERDPHGNVQVSRIETEKLIQKLVETELEARKAAGLFKGKFACLTHFLGYEGRCSLVRRKRDGEREGGGGGGGGGSARAAAPFPIAPLSLTPHSPPLSRSAHQL